MEIIPHSSDKKLRVLKIVVGGAALIGLGAGKLLWDLRPRSMAVAKKVDLDQFLGHWYEIARKPVVTERSSFKNIRLEYTLQSENHLNLELRYQTKEGRIGQFHADIKIVNAPDNSKFLIKYLPSIFRYLRKGHHWIMQIDPKGQVVLIGNPNRKSLWLLARSPQLDSSIVEEYLNIAKTAGFKLNDLITVKHE